MSSQSSLQNADETNNEFSHGLDNGKLDLEKKHYESFLSSQVLYNQSIEKLQNRKSELARLETELQEAQKESAQWIEKSQQHTHQIPLKEQQADRLRDTANKAGIEKEQLRELRKNTRNDNPFLIGLFYVLAGLLFITGDLIISKDIVAYAFGFKGFEAWSFAGGLAALSLLLKPAYERLIEHYYQEGKYKRYIYFKMVLLFFALTTMAVLGLYRYDAFRVDKMKAFLNNEATYLQSGAGTNSPTLIAKLDSLRRQRIQLNEELLNDPWGAWSFVLTGILFAVSGAVCLGVGTPIVQTYWKRWVQIPIRIGQMKRLEKRTQKQLEKVETQLSQEKAQKAISENHLAMFSKPEELQSEIKTIRAEIRDLTDQQGLYDVERRVSQYNDGYVRGKVEQRTEQRPNGHVDIVNANGQAVHS
ncbi:hypothetical protein [Xanthocytophaga agilis]|uniref:Uncharacterized protein n=1 Tax=Xanthocytophaga agilis TaxID=3048010 RepID=A0AAE3RA13_9BACT|nr:hypothetical protein [Xanthocytophaga agilis]MDJ1503483.1 hypothetical protein [Xanthocytophaga agilis]